MTDAADKVEGLVEFVARSLVDEPDSVTVTSFEEDDGTLVIEVSASGSEVGKLIGRGGRTINAIRSVVRAAAVKREQRILVDVVDPE